MYVESLASVLLLYIHTKHANITNQKELYDNDNEILEMFSFIFDFVIRNLFKF